ncbi:probable methyltransferase At1g29790 [Phragmites australis]|uniref:probable methyltransferase At1g29790 n=1 Tax=Phragmites australis TaxID=29695 RepID=UPI002D765BA8|nr:probable methyltransferase At1g29790 [Phragmites australis]
MRKTTVTSASQITATGGGGWPCGGGLNLSVKLNVVLLLSVVATNLVSLYQLSLRAVTAPPLLPPLLQQQQLSHRDDDLLIRQLDAIRAGVSQLNHLRSSSPPPPPPPPELLLYSHLAPVASACSAHPDLLHRYMSYAPFAPCPDDALSLAEPLLLRGCHPLPRRRCFAPTTASSASMLKLPTDPFSPLPDGAVRWPKDGKCRSFSCLPPSLGFDVARTEAGRFLRARGPLDLTAPQLLRLASLSRAGPIRLGLDIGGGTGTLAARLKKLVNATVLTTTMNLGAPYSEAAAARGVVPLHAPLQQRFPVGDGTMDVVRAGHAVNRWIPEAALEFLWYDADRVLRPGGLLWVDHFWCRRADLEGVYAAMLRRLGYKTIKWAVGDRTVGKDEVYLTALLQKPFG